MQPFLSVVLLVAATSAWAAVDATSRCQATRLSVTGRYATRSARCHARAQGIPFDRSCLDGIGTKLERGLLRADRAGACPAGAVRANVQPSVERLMDRVAAALQVSTPGSACGAAKLRAVGRYVAKQLQLRGSDLVDPDPQRFPTLDARARAKLTTAFLAIEGKQACLTTGDAAAIASNVDGFLADAMAMVKNLPLRAVAQPSGRWIGSAVRADVLASEPEYGEVLAREFDYLIPESETNWIAVHPSPDVWNWEPVDRIVEFAEAHAMRIRISALIWWFLLPDYVKAMTPDELRVATEERVRTMVARYRGRVAAYDVVNEPFLFGTSLFPSVFLQKLGPGYIADALRWAREEDPDALLLLNDLGVEDIGPASDALYAFAKDLLAAGAPLDGIGLEMHIGFGRVPVRLRQNIQRFADLGLRVGISELDDQIRGLPGTLAERIALQGTRYHDIVADCVAIPACFAVSTWGFTDKHSWIDSFFGPDDPLPLDDFYQPKPAYFGLRGALAGN